MTSLQRYLRFHGAVVIFTVLLLGWWFVFFETQGDTLLLELEGHDPVGSKERFARLRKAVDIGHMGKDVVGDNQLSRTPLLNDVSSDLQVQKLVYNVETLAPSNIGCSSGRFDPQACHTGFGKEAQKGSVVCRHFDNPVTSRKGEICHSRLDVLLAVVNPGA